MSRLLALAAISALLLFWACRLSAPDAQDHFDVAGDSTWTACDNVLVQLLDKDGNTVDTLFDDVLHSLSQLKNLSAAKYDGSKATLLITGTKGDGLCFEETRTFEGDGASLIIDTIKSSSARVQGVAADPESLFLPLGAPAAVIKASIKPAYADQSVLWSLPGDGVVSLGIPSGGDGGQVKILPAKVGNTIVTVRSRKDPSLSARIVVAVIEPAGMQAALDRDSLVLYLGGAPDSLHATILPATAGQQVEWKSLDSSVAVVDSLGRIKAVGVGDSYVVAKSLASGIQASARVVVKRDIPKLIVASKTGAPVNTDVSFSPRAVQEYGAIVMFKWDLDGDGNWDDSLANPGVGLNVGLPPQTAKYAKEGSYTARFMVRDGEGNEADAKVVLDIGNQAPEILAIRADTIISIKDSIRMTASVKDVDGKVAWCGWDYDGDGKFDDSIAAMDSSLTVALGHRYPDAGLYPAVFKAKDESGKTRLDTVRIRVELDAPIASLGNDTTVTVGSRITVRAQASDKFGDIEKWELLIPGQAGFRTLGKQDTILTAPAEAGTLLIVLRVTDDDGLTDSDSMTVNVVLSANADLSGLVFSAGALDPVFKPSISFYTGHATFADSLITILPTAKDSGAKIYVNAKPVASGTVSDAVKMAVGANPNAFQIVVTAADGTQHVYSLSIARDPSADASLSRLDVAGFALKPAFSSNILAYADTVASTVAYVTLKPTLTVATASLSVNDSAMASGTATYPMPLAIGGNLFKITVASQGGLIKTVYQVKVVRRAQLVLQRSLDGRPATQTDSLETVSGSPLRILSAPVTGFHFLRWTVLEGAALLADSSANPGSLTLRSAKARAQADFAADKYSITAEANAGGSIAPSGAIPADYGQSQSFTIVTVAGNRLKSVTVDGADATVAAAGGSYAFANIAASHAINVLFVKSDTIITQAGANGNLDPAKLIVDEGADTAITVTPAPGFKVATFKVDSMDVFASLVGNRYPFKAVKGNHRVEATFIQGFTLTATAGPGGSITPLTAAVSKGDVQIFTITPNPDFRLRALLDNGKDATAAVAGGEYTLSNIDRAHTLSLVFSKVSYPVTATVVQGEGTISPAAIDIDSLGSQIFTFAPAAHYRLYQITAGKTILVADTNATHYTLTAVTGKYDLQAFFWRKFTIGAVASDSGNIAIPNPIIDSTASQTITVTPNTGYRVDAVFDNGAQVKTSGASYYGAQSFSLAGISADHSIAATFKRYYTLTAASNDVGLGKVDPVSINVDEGGTASFNLYPAGGAHFRSLSDNGVPVAPVGAVYTLSNVTQTHSVNAVFVPLYTLIVADSIDGLPYDSVSHPQKICVSVKGGKQQCQTSPFKAIFEAGTEFTLQTDSTINYPYCYQDYCLAIPVNFAEWVQSQTGSKVEKTVLGPANPLDSANSFTPLVLKAETHIQAVYSQGLKTDDAVIGVTGNDQHNAQF